MNVARGRSFFQMDESACGMSRDFLDGKLEGGGGNLGRNGWQIEGKTGQETRQEKDGEYQVKDQVKDAEQKNIEAR